jgi:hypothetical protein
MKTTSIKLFILLITIAFFYSCNANKEEKLMKKVFKSIQENDFEMYLELYDLDDYFEWRTERLLEIQKDEKWLDMLDMDDEYIESEIEYLDDYIEEFDVKQFMKERKKDFISIRDNDKKYDFNWENVKILEYHMGMTTEIDKFEDDCFEYDKQIEESYFLLDLGNNEKATLIFDFIVYGNRYLIKEIKFAKGVTPKDPIADVQLLFEQMEEYSALARAAVEDKILNDDEIVELNKLAAQRDEFEKAMDEKYKDYPDAKKKFDKYIEDNKAELEKVYEEFFNTLMALYECEGADKLE